MPGAVAAAQASVSLQAGANSRNGVGPASGYRRPQWPDSPDVRRPLWRLVVTKVHVLQVNTDPANVADLTAAVDAGRTDNDGWQMPKNAATGDLVIWYAAGRQQFIARGWVEAPARPVETGPGPFRGHVVGVRGIKPVGRRKVMEECGLNGGIQSYQTVKDEIAVAFLRSIGQLD
jgi:hypothetical protein